MAQVHVNVASNIKQEAADELTKRGQTLTSEIRQVLYRLARLDRLSAKMRTVPKTNPPLSARAARDLHDRSTVSVKDVKKR